MARPMTEFTKAVRQLCDETNGQITYSEARPRLKAMGHDVADEPERRTEEVRRWEEYEVDYDDPESIKVTANACGFDEATTRRVVREAKKRKQFAAESNSFNVAKAYWQKNRESARPSVSRKPSGSKNTKAKTARRSSTLPPPKHGRGRVRVAVGVPSDIEEALAVVEKYGGLNAAQSRVSDIDAEVQKLNSEKEAVEAALRLAEEFQRRLNAA